jgi:hypothetical protein
MSLRWLESGLPAGIDRRRGRTSRACSYSNNQDGMLRAAALAAR